LFSKGRRHENERERRGWFYTTRRGEAWGMYSKRGI